MSWQPDSYLSGETEKSQEEKRLWMVYEYAREDQDVGKVSEFWETTYASQRFAINQKDSIISRLCSEWPFLKQPVHLLGHFRTLMGFDLV